MTKKINEAKKTSLLFLATAILTLDKTNCLTQWFPTWVQLKDTMGFNKALQGFDKGPLNCKSSGNACGYLLITIYKIKPFFSFMG